MSITPKPFALAVPDQEIADLRDRLRLTRFPDQAPGEPWAYGTDLGWMRDLVAYWRDGFDWRAQEARLNAFPQFTAPLSGIDVHFLHVPGKGDKPLPLLLSELELGMRDSRELRPDSWRFSVWEAALLGLSLNEAAYLSEILRAGILAVPKGQREAALALGLRRGQVFRLVTWPQALRIVIPPLGNSVNGLLKTTSVASVISVDELLRRTQVLIQERFMVLELFLVAALYYLVLTTLWDLVQRRLERRFGRGYANESADRR